MAQEEGPVSTRLGPGQVRPRPPTQGIAEARARAYNTWRGRPPAGGKGAVLESWDGQCPGPITEKVKKRSLGAEIRRGSTQWKQGGGPPKRRPDASAPRPAAVAGPRPGGRESRSGGRCARQGRVAVGAMGASERGGSGTPFHPDKSEPRSRGLLSGLRRSKARTRPVVRRRGGAPRLQHAVWVSADSAGRKFPRLQTARSA